MGKRDVCGEAHTAEKGITSQAKPVTSGGKHSQFRVGVIMLNAIEYY